MLDITELIDIFNLLSRIELEKGRFYPSRAFKTTANRIQNCTGFKVDGSRVILEFDNDTKEVLGQSSSDIFIEFMNTGKSSRLNDEVGYLVESSELTKISGIGEVKAKMLIEAGIDSISKLDSLKLNVGDTIPNTRLTYSRNIDTGLKFYLATGNERISREKAYEYLLNFKKFLLDNKVENFEMYPVGSYRRRKSTVGDIDIILVSKADAKISDNVLEVVSKWFDSLFVYGNTKIAGVKGRTQVDVRLIDRKYLGAHILHGTGSQEFNIKIRAHAKSLGLSLNEYGIVKDGELITFDKELDIFNYLNYPYLEPWNR